MRHCLILTLLLSGPLGCSASGGDAYLRFAIDGQSHEVERMQFVAMKLPDGRHFLDLSRFPTNEVPSAAIQWRMSLEDVEQLEGQELDLSYANQPDAASLFTLDADLAAHQDRESTLRLRISRVEGGYVEGTFAGADFVFTSMTRDTVRRVGISGDFRATLIVQ